MCIRDRNTDFSNANLTQAKLMETNITLANLNGANLEGVNLRGTTIGLSVCLITNYIGCAPQKVIPEVE